jgi:putative ABC transport system ATP-binding protein
VTDVSLLVLEGVSKSYRDGEAWTNVLDAVQLELRRGETASLVGVSGSGKSTLLSLVAGLLLPDAGQIVFDGEELTALDDTARAELRARRIGVMLQSGNLIPFLTARENVELAIGLAANGRSASARAEELLSELGLGRRMDHLPRRLSGGETQRVALAMALANEPDLLLADEVAGELDSDTTEQVMSVILDAWRERGLTVLLVTHNLELAGLAKRQLRLAGGKVEEEA